MKKCLKKLGERFVTLILIFLGIFLVILSIDSYTKTDNSTNRMLWQQSTERQLQEAVDSYTTRIHERYARMERDLTSYQSTTNRRIISLYLRVERLEEYISELEDRVKGIPHED